MTSKSYPSSSTTISSSRSDTAASQAPSLWETYWADPEAATYDLDEFTYSDQEPPSPQAEAAFDQAFQEALASPRPSSLPLAKAPKPSKLPAPPLPPPPQASNAAQGLVASKGAEVPKEKEAPSEPATPSASTSGTPVAAATGKGGDWSEADPAWVQNFQGPRGVFLVFVFSFLLFGIFAGDRLFRQSDNPHYVLLSDALLKGRWHLDGPPIHPVTGRRLDNDWAYYDVVRMKDGKIYRGITLRRSPSYLDFRTTQKEKRPLYHHQIAKVERIYFVSFPPLPAFLMMPAMWTLEKIGYPRLRYNDTVFTILFAAGALALLFWLLQSLALSGMTQRSLYDNLLLSLLFGFGTVFFYVSVQGTVWFTALVLGVFCTLGFIASTFRKQPLLAGIFLAGAFLSRPLLLLGGLLFLWFLLRDEDGWVNPFTPERLEAAFLFALPLAIAGGGMMWANVHRFQNPFEFGHTYLPSVYHRVMQYGLFHPHWFPRNFFASFVALPTLVPRPPYLVMNAHGASLFFTTPLFLLLFWAKPRHTVFAVFALIAVLLAVPPVFYQNSGWVTFGNRFSVDYTPFLILLLAFSDLRIGRLFLGLLLFSLAVNAFGAITFNRFDQFYNTDYYSLDWIYRFFRF